MEANERLTVHHCWCGVEHAIPNNLSQMAQEDKQGVSCPLGHTWWIRKTETQKLREKLSGVEAELSETQMDNERLTRKVRNLEKKKPKKKKKKAKEA